MKRTEKILFDAHTHLNFEEYTDEERKRLAEEIDESAVKYIVDAGDSVESSKAGLANAHAYPWCYAAVGIHPEHAKKVNSEMLEEIETLAKDEKCVAIGEIGLDFHYGKEYKEEQIDLFRKQIGIAIRLNMPIMIHSRDADQLTMDILKEEGAFGDERTAKFPAREISGISGVTKLPDARVQLHCFSGSKELAMEYIKLGATISIGGPVTFKNGKKTAGVAAALPIETLLSETDAPYLAPEPFRGRQNKSQYVEHVVRRIAFLKGMEYEEAARVLTANGVRFFNIREK